jgi:S1-C subfamily serine protease
MAGLGAGDVLLSLDGKTVTGFEELSAALEAARDQEVRPQSS